MKCSKAQKLIGDYIDGELDGKKASLLKDHLQVCPECRKLFEDFEQIAHKAKGLAERAPSGQVWYRIQARLRETNQEKVRPVRIQKERFLLFPARLRYAVSAALLFLLVAAGAVFIGYRVLNQEVSIRENNGQAYALKKIKEAEMHYQLAIKALWDAVQAQKENFDPELARTFLTNLEIIDASLAECKKAVERDPGDLDSRYYLLAVYEKKAELLNDMMDIPASSPLAKESKTIF